MKVLNFGFDLAVWYNDDGTVRLPLPNQLHLETKYKHSFQERLDRINKLKTETGVRLPGKGDLFIPQERWFHSDMGDIFFKHVKSDYTYNMYDLQYLALNPDVHFIYPIMCYTQHIFGNMHKVALSPNLLECVKRGQAKIHFHVTWEGFLFDDPFFTFHDYHMKPKDFLESILLLIDRYDLPDNSILISSANLRSNEMADKLLNGRKKTFTIFEIDWFKESKWCTNRTTEGVEDKFKMCINSKKFKKHILSMNRVQRHHRTIIHSELTSNEKLKDKVSISFNKITEDTHKEHFKLLSEDYKHGKDRLVNADFKTDKVLDVGFKTFKNTYFEAPINLAFTFAWDYHNSTFVNLVSETLVTNTTVFVTEKIHKPIVAAQPFIVVGNPFYLKKMKEQGYRTFNEFWDESYDLEEDFTRRFEKIVDVLEEISTWSLEKCHDVYEKMKPIIIHNFENYMNEKGYHAHLDFMYEHTTKQSSKPKMI